MSYPFGTPEQAFTAYMSRPSTDFEAAMTELYELGNVPDQGRSYLIRCFAQTRAGRDRVRVGEQYRSITCQTLAHYRRTGTAIVPEEDIVFDDRYGAAVSGDRPVEFFMFDPQANQLVPDGRRYHAVMANEDKCAWALRRQQQGHSIPNTVVVLNHPEGYYVADYERPSPERAWHLIGCRRGRIKAAFCASGNDNIGFSDFYELETLMRSPEWRDRNYVVQADVGSEDFSNVYYSDGVKVYFVCSTRQENSGTNGEKYESNFLDNSHAGYSRPVTDPMAKDAHEQGVVGFFGIDGRLNRLLRQVWAVECNARITAPVYGWLLMMRHGTEWFCVVNLKNIAHDTVEAMLPLELEFSPTNRCGGIFHNPGPLLSERAGSLTVLAPTEAGGLEKLAAIRAHAFASEDEAIEAA